MGDAYPDVVKNRDFITGVITREEERFRQTLRTGLVILEDELAGGRHGPARGHGLQAARHLRLPARGDHRDHRRARGRRSTSTASTSRWPSSGAGPRKPGRPTGADDDERIDRYRELVEQFGTTEFFGDGRGRRRGPGARRGARGEQRRAGPRRGREIFTDRTPFYAESGGQVGDTGTITTETGRADVIDTTYALPGLRRHVASHRRGRDHRRPGGARRHRRRAAAGHPPQPHRHAHPALGAARGARRAREAGRLARRPRPPAVRLQPLRRGHARGDRADRGPRQRARCSPTSGSGPTRPRRPRPRPWAPSPSSATSTATSCGCSRPAATAWSCAAAPTSAPSATSAPSRS